MTSRVKVTTYVEKSTKERWEKHLKETNPKYNGMSHFLEDSAEYKIKADTMPINKIFGKVGPQKK